MVHESHISPEDYPTMMEHMLALTPDQLAGRTELLDKLAEALPLAEAAGILGPNYPLFLWRMCARHANPRMFSEQPKNLALALPYADALVAAQPDDDKGREIRAYCRARLTPPDYAALLADYDWLARRPLRGLAYWTCEVRNVDNTAENNAYLVNHYTQEDLYRRTHYCLASAWACYHLGDLNGAAEAFARGFAEPVSGCFGFDPEWPVDLLPPVPDDDYLLWQMRQQIRGREYESIPMAVKDWLGMALRTMSPGHYARFIA